MACLCELTLEAQSAALVVQLNGYEAAAEGGDHHLCSNGFCLPGSGVADACFQSTYLGLVIYVTGLKSQDKESQYACGPHC